MSVETRYLGKDIREPIDDLDTFPAPEGLGTVVMTSDEVTSLCPVTGQPDYYQVEICYKPDQRCIESKSLKLYLWHFRQQALYCEKLAVVIRDKVISVCQPHSCTVTLVQQPRGGITIQAVSSYPEDS